MVGWRSRDERFNERSGRPEWLVGGDVGVGTVSITVQKHRVCDAMHEHQSI